MRREATPLDFAPVLERAAPLFWAAVVAMVAAFAGLAIAVGQGQALLLCVAVVASLFILFDFRAGVVLLILMMPVSASHVFPHAMFGITGLNPLNLLLAATFVSFGVRELGKGGLRGFVPRPLFWLYIIPVIIAGLIGMGRVDEIALSLRMMEAIFFTDGAGYFRDMAVKPLFMVLFALLVAAAVSRSRDPERFLMPMVASMWIMCLMVVLFVVKEGVSLAVLSSAQARHFFAPLGMHANDLGRLYLVAYALLLFTWARTDRSFLKILLLASMALVVGALVLTFSRGALLGFGLVNLWFLFSRRSAGAFIVALAIIGILVVAMPGSVVERLSTMFTGEMGDRSAGRTDQIWTPLVPELWKSPIWGQGLGSIMWSDAMRSGRMLEVLHPHNAYLRAALDFGFAGALALLAYLAIAWKGFRKLANDAGLSPTMRGFFEGAHVGLLGFLLAAMAGSSLSPVPEQSFLWLAIGLMYGWMNRKDVE